MQKCRKGEGGSPPREAAQQPRAYWHEVILYPEDANTGAVIGRVVNGWAEWVSIMHDRDTDPETGELKRAHLHILLKSRSGRTAAAVARELLISPEDVQLKSNGEKSMAYLLHATDKARLDGKYRYQAEDLHGPLAAAAAEAAQKVEGALSEGAQVVSILDHIEGTPKNERISMADLARWAARSGLWASFRRAAVIFKTVLEEHNATADAIRQEEAARAELERPVNDPLRFAKLKAQAAREGRL